jgi:hypothetical protein
MKTTAQVNDAVSEIIAVCKKHGIVLVGTCQNESIYGEIAIIDSDSLSTGWLNVQEQITNKVVSEVRNIGAEEFWVSGIGDIEGT